MQTSTWLRCGCVLQSGIDSSIYMTPTHKWHTWKMRHDQVSIYIYTYIYTYNMYEVSESPTHISTVGTNRAGASTWAERSMANVRMIISSCLYGRRGLTWFVFLITPGPYVWLARGLVRIGEDSQISVGLKQDSLYHYQIGLDESQWPLSNAFTMHVPSSQTRYLVFIPWHYLSLNTPNHFSRSKWSRGWSNGGCAK